MDERRGAGAHHRDGAGAFLDALAAAHLEEGRGERQPPSRSRNPDGLRSGRAVAQGTRRGRRGGLPYGRTLLLLPGLVSAAYGRWRHSPRPSRLGSRLDLAEIRTSALLISGFAGVPVGLG